MIAQINRQLRHSLVAGLLFAGFPSADAADYEASAPQYEANAGQSLVVPISINDATGLAQIRLQVNYNDQVVDFTGSSAGDLGQSYDLEISEDKSSVTIDAVRAENLTEGSGVLVWLDFLPNSGSEANQFTDLTIAQFEGGDATGVRDLNVGNTFSVLNGSITISLDTNIDNSGNRLPDWWEQSFGLDPYKLTAQGDEENDGISNLLEYAMGGSPVFNDSASLKQTFEVGADDYYEFTFRRRKGDNDLSFQVLETSDLSNSGSWTGVDLGTRMVGAPVDLGDDIESVTVRSKEPASSAEGPDKLFMRLEVLR